MLTLRDEGLGERQGIVTDEDDLIWCCCDACHWSNEVDLLFQQCNSSVTVIL